MLQGRPRLPHLQNGGNRMDIEAGKTLTNEEVIRELLELLNAAMWMDWRKRLIP